MYIGRSNRGVSFTKAGFYTIGLVLLLGFFATGSGYNGLFLALGFGLSFLLISGLLSEKTIQAVELVGVADTVAEANVPFSVDFKIANTSPTWFVFSLESLVTTELPKFKFLQTHIDSLMEARLLMLPPGQTVPVPGRCRGIRRGWYHDFFIIQRTLFPFGMISKFKVARLNANISVLPSTEPNFAALINQDLRSRLANQPDEQEFHSHRLLETHTPLHSLDWKKNAGRPVEEWLVKVYETPTAEFGFWIDPVWEEIEQSPTEESYENVLSVLRTACDAIHRTGKPMLLKGGNHKFFFGYDDCVSVLVKAPYYATRRDLGNTTEGGQPKRGWYLRLKISASGHSWDREPIFLAV